MIANQIHTVSSFVNEVLSWKKGGRGNGEYYHKVFLILSFADIVKYGLNEGNKIYLDDRLEQLFRHYWETYEQEVSYDSTKKIMNPIFRLQNNGLWKLANDRITEDKSYNVVKKNGEYGFLDSIWINFFSEPTLREAFKKNLVDYYFKLNLDVYAIKDVEEDESLERVAKKVLNKEKAKPEEIFLRNVAFRKKVNEVYNYSCCVSESKVRTSRFSLIEAAHIIDFAVDHNDSIDNGIALNPFFHKAFDVGLFTIEKNGPDAFQVIVSKQFEEYQNSVIRIKEFNGRLINLPNNREYYPNPDFLKWHQNNQFERFLE